MTPAPPVRLGLTGAILVAALAAGAGERTGTLFEDLDGDGRQGVGEPAVAGVAVNNGREVVRSDEQGRYRLPDAGRFVALTRPEGFAAETWYHAGAEASDFALRRQDPTPGGFFFIQISDAHVFGTAREFLRFSLPERPSWLPAFVANGLGHRRLVRLYAPRSSEQVDGFLRVALGESGANPRVELSGGALLGAYLAEFGRPGSRLGAVEGKIRAAFDEVFALAPQFVVNTGDLLLEANTAPPEVAARWLDLYRGLTRGRGVSVFDTIGNNELVGFLNSHVAETHPDYGLGLWQRVQGPTHYSWDRGGFHFVALDTHRPLPTWRNERDWSFGTLRDEVRSWLDQDLAMHADRTLVVFNHEPFALDPSWPFVDEDRLASDEGIFEARGVDYVLTGHTHLNGKSKVGDVEHVTTGALSGFRWLLPHALHPRGYRLWWAESGRLLGAWKPVGEAVLALAHPAPADGSQVLVAADREGPFVSVEVRQGDALLQTKRLGAYFLRIEAPASGPLHVTGRRADGSELTIRLEPPAGFEQAPSATGGDPPIR